MRTIYETTITEIGSQVSEALEGRMFVLFADFVPDELRSICVCHLHSKAPRLNFRKGDILKIGPQEMRICWVGKVAMKTFKEMGHFTVNYFNEEVEEAPEDLLPGAILVHYVGTPTFEPGMNIQVLRESAV